MSNAIGYRASKAGANMVAICLQEALVDRNILVWPFHPGYVKTRMTGHADGAIPVEESANGPFFVVAFSMEMIGGGLRGVVACSRLPPVQVCDSSRGIVHPPVSCNLNHPTL